MVTQILLQIFINNKIPDYTDSAKICSDLKATLTLEQVGNKLDRQFDFLISCRNINFLKKFRN